MKLVGRKNISLYAKPCSFFWNLPRAPSKFSISAKEERINPTAPPSASYVVYSMLDM